MKKMIITVALAIFCSTFVKAQTSSVVKKATLMPEGTVITDLKTGEVIRTVKSGVSINDIERNTINLTDLQNGGAGKTAEPTNSNHMGGSSNPLNTNKAKQPVDKNKSPKKD